MRIIYLHYLEAGASGLLHVAHFADAARRLGHRVEVHALNRAGKASNGPGAPARPRRRLGLLLSRYLREPRELARNALYLGRERAIVGPASPEALLVRHDPLTASYLWTARRLDLPLIVEANGAAVELRHYSGDFLHLARIAHRLEGLRLRRADGIVCVSTALKDYLVSTHGLDASKIRVAPNGADVETFHPGVTPDPAIPERRPASVVVGFVGSFQKFHGVDLLARLTVTVARARPAVRFLFVGDGPDAAAVRQASTELGERLTLTGRVPFQRVPGLVAAFDIGLLPETVFYASPLKVLEWMAAGKAVVAPRYAPLEEIIDDGGQGILFPPGDLDAMAAAVVRLIDDPALRRQLGEAAAARVRSSLTWEHNARRVMAACSEARDRHRACSDLSSGGSR